MLTKVYHYFMKGLLFHLGGNWIIIKFTICRRMKQFSGKMNLSDAQGRNFSFISLHEWEMNESLLHVMSNVLKSPLWKPSWEECILIVFALVWRGTCTKLPFRTCIHASDPHNKVMKYYWVVLYYPPNYWWDHETQVINLPKVRC